MKAFSAILVGLLLCGASVAEETTLTKVTFSASQSTLTIAVFEGRSYLIRVVAGQPPAFDPVTITYLQLGSDGPINPPPPPPPMPGTPLEKHKAAVKAALASVTSANKTETAAALRKLYVTIADLPVTERSQLVQATDIMFNALTLPSDWKAWKAAVDASLAQFTELTDARSAWKATGEAVSP